MRRTINFTILIFLVAAAIQSRILRPGDLTPTWPLVVAIAVGAVFAMVEYRRTRQPAP